MDDKGKGTSGSVELLLHCCQEHTARRTPGKLRPAVPAAAGGARAGPVGAADSGANRAVGPGAHLHDERAVLGTGLAVEVLAAVVGVPEEDLGMQHRRVAELGTVAAAQQPPGQLALVHHGRHHVVGAPQRLPPESLPAQLRHLPPARRYGGCRLAPLYRGSQPPPEARRRARTPSPGRAQRRPDGATAISLRPAQQCSCAPSPPETSALPAGAARGGVLTVRSSPPGSSAGLALPVSTVAEGGTGRDVAGLFRSVALRSRAPPQPVGQPP